MHRHEHIGVGTVCEAFVQEPCVHPQMLSRFKDLGHVVQDLCASHSPEGTEAEEKKEEDSEEAQRTMATAVKELRAIMEKQDGN